MKVKPVHSRTVRRFRRFWKRAGIGTLSFVTLLSVASCRSRRWMPAGVEPAIPIEEQEETNSTQ